jgi:tetratricopeptide (TPR) repeat protein
VDAHHGSRKLSGGTVLKPIFVGAFAALLASNAYAQGAAAGHKNHVPVQKTPWKEMPAPALRSGYGNSELTITTDSPQAQAYFNQGLRLLHCFWEFEAYRAFKEAARLDPKAAMPQWGIAMALDGDDAMKEQHKAAMAKANELAPGASEHEQFYIRAMSKRMAEGDWEKKSVDYRRELEALLDRFPQDHDARAFLAISRFGYDDEQRPREGTIYAQSLLKQVLHAHPQHAAAHHYWIHLLESSSHPEDALASADVLGKIAPLSGHMVHMPGHIYYRTGNYDRAYESFAAAARVDEAYMKDQGVTTAETWNYIHNLSYLVAACAESGRYKEGLAWATKLKGGEDGRPSAGKFYYALNPGSTLARLHIRFADWQAAANAPIEFGVDESEISAIARAYRSALEAYTKGMAAASSGKLQEAERLADALDAALWRMTPQSMPKKSDTDKEADDENPEYLSRILAVASLDLRGSIASGRGQIDEAERVLSQAVRKEKELGYGEPPVLSRPATESLGYARLRAKQWDKAREAFTASLKDRPKNGHALFGLAQSYALAGDVAEATRAHREFLSAWSNADPELPQVRTAKQWLAKRAKG